jgi:asparaginyl-tRNA synthetase
MGIVYIDEAKGSDATGTPGTQESPFKTVQQAYITLGADNDFQVLKDGAADEGYKPAAKSALKKAANYVAAQKKKTDAAAKRAEQDAKDKAALEATIEAAKNIKISEDKSLPAAVLISLGETDTKIVGKLRKSKDEPTEGVSRVRVLGRVNRVAKQGNLVFVTLRRGLNLMQCLLAGNLAKTYDALTLSKETSIEIFGELWEVPPGAHAPLNRELHADYFRIISKAPSGDDAITNRVPEDAEPSSLLNLRHLHLRSDKPTAVMYVRDIMENAFFAAYKELDIKKVSPPA